MKVTHNIQYNKMSKFNSYPLRALGVSAKRSRGKLSSILLSAISNSRVSLKETTSWNLVFACHIWTCLRRFGTFFNVNHAHVLSFLLEYKPKIDLNSLFGFEFIEYSLDTITVQSRSYYIVAPWYLLSTVQPTIINTLTVNSDVLCVGRRHEEDNKEQTMT